MSKIDKTFKKGEQLRASDLNLIVDAINDSAIQSGTGENSMVQNGGYCDASGDYSSAFGWGTKAGSNNAHAEGDGTEANEYASHAEGSHTIANNRNEHAEGLYNVSHTNTIHSTGIGNENERKNAFEIMQDGSAYLYGIGGYVGTDIKDATHPNIKTLQEVIAEGGGDGGKVFVATYNDTTYDEVTAALAEDKTVIVNYNNRAFTFLQEDVVYFFVAIGGSELSNFTIEMIVLSPDNEWNHYGASDIASVANLEDGLDTKLDKPSAAGAAGQVLTSDGQGGKRGRTSRTRCSRLNTGSRPSQRSKRRMMRERCAE